MKIPRLPLDWIFDQLLRRGTAERIVLAVLTGLLEREWNPWLRQTVGLDVERVEVLDASPKSGRVRLILTFRRTR